MAGIVKLAAAAALIALAAPAAAGNESRSCASVIGATDGGGLVAYIIRFSGAAWWAEFFARARPCG